MNYSDYAAIIRRNVSAVRVGEALGLSPDKAGFCRCPVHADKTASMKLYPGDRGWYCFGCHEGGSVIDLVMACEGLDFKNAVAWVNDTFNLRLPIGAKATKEQEAAARRLAEERERKLKEREEKQKARDKAFQEYLDLGKELMEMERDLEDYAPKPSDEEWHVRFKRAVMQIPILKDQIDYLALICIGKGDDE